MSNYKVAILMGSPNDMDKMKPAADMLERFGIEADVRVHSAHRTPAKVTELASTAPSALLASQLAAEVAHQQLDSAITATQALVEIAWQPQPVPPELRVSQLLIEIIRRPYVQLPPDTGEGGPGPFHPPRESACPEPLPPDTPPAGGSCPTDILP